jgi:autotransporter-associated beta strand protein
LVKTGDGTLVLSGLDNTYTGGTAVNGGVVEAASVADATAVGRIGTGYLAIANNATFRYTGTGSETTTRNFWIDTGSDNKTIEIVSATASVTFSGTGGNINKPFTKTGDGALTIADQINAGATVTVNAGRLTLTGANAYTGATTVNGGVLAVNGTSIADGGDLYLTATGAVEVSGTETVNALYINGVQQIAGTYGATGSGATFTDNTRFSGTGVVNVLTGALPPYQAWAQAKGLDGTEGKDPALTVDPDGDGVNNLLEFYLDGNPLANNGAILPQPDLSDPLYLKFTFKRLDEAEGDVISQVMQFGTDLTGWVDVALPAASFTHTSGPANGVIVTVVENGAAADDITVAIPIGYEQDGRLFGRIRVVK